MARSLADRAAPVCLELSRRAPLSERQRFADAVGRIQAAWGPRSRVLRQERLFGQLLSANGFADETRAKLPPSLLLVLKLGPDAL